ncbi:hypothetical protein [Nitrobacter sp.]|uniref:hypothetical protein n=1 Tax=Nitrobacter sp. TaxID=29420 RepID=UPI0029CAB816|nr:hypothetical protein [Nitrobacter sp.]
MLLVQFCRKHLYLVLLALCLILITIPQMRKSYLAADGLPFTWTTSKVWLESAECARATSKFLVLCPSSAIEPIANGFGGDDLGHALALEIYSVITGKAALPTHISLLNTTINYLSLLTLASLLLAMGLPFVCLSLLAVGPSIANQFHALTPHPAQFGVACLVSILPLAVLGNPRISRTWVAIGIVALALAFLFREAIGMMGVVTSLLALLLRLFSQRGKFAITQMILLAAIITVSATPYFLLRGRDAIYNLPPAKKLESHGTWANLYMGLGGAANPFGIEWNDFSAINAVKAVDPSVEYLSPRFYQILKDRYFEIVRSNPVGVATVYLKKFEVTLQTRMPVWIRSFPLWLIIAALSVAGTLTRRIVPINQTMVAYDAVLIVSGIYVAAFVAQATLFSFDLQYLFPIQLFLLLSTAVVVDIMFRQINIQNYSGWKGVAAKRGK